MTAQEMLTIRNPLVTTEELAILATSKSKEIRRMVASHDKTDLKTLLILARDPWLPVSNLALVNKNMKRSASIPILTERILEDPYFVITHRHVTPELLDALLTRALEVADENLMCDVAMHRRTSSETLHKIMNGASSRARAAAIQNANFDIELLVASAHDKSYAVRTAIAGRADLTTELAELLAKDSSVHVLKALSGNKVVCQSTRSEVETKLAERVEANVEHNWGRVIDHVTKLVNEPMTQARLQEFAQDATPGIRIGVHLAAYDQGLISLADCLLSLDRERWVAVTTYLRLIDPMKSLDIVLGSKKADPLHHVLSEDWTTRDDVVRRALETRIPQFAYDVVRFVELKPWMLEKLHGIDRYTLSRIVRNWPSGIAGDAIVDLGQYYAFVPDVVLALHPDTSPEIMAQLRESRLTCVQAALVSRMSSDELRASSTKRIPIRVAVARNKNTPEDVLLKLSLDKDRSVRQAVLRNPKVTDAMRARIALLAE